MVAEVVAATGALSGESWVIGLQAPGDGPRIIPWQRVLFCRLTQRHHEVGQRVSTRGAESSGAMRQSVYFYLGRNDPAYCAAPIAAHRPGCVDSLLVAPFDTGGLLSKRIHLKWWARWISPQRVVRRHTYGGLTFMHRWMRWGRANYGTSARYTLGEPPKRHESPLVDLQYSAQLPDGTGTRAWTWEGTIPSDPVACASVEAGMLSLSRANMDAYESWLRDADILTPAQVNAHLDAVALIRKDPGTVDEGHYMNQILAGQDQWSP